MTKITHWKTKAGELIPISELKDDHLTNIVNMMLQKSNVGAIRWNLLCDAYAFQGQCRGEGAFDAAGTEIHNIECMDDADLLSTQNPLFAAVYKEWRKRNGPLDPPTDIPF